MKASEELRIWIGDTKPPKEVKSWMNKLDKLERAISQANKDIHDLNQVSIRAGNEIMEILTRCPE